MRLHHLIEAATSHLTTVWQGVHANTLVTWLKMEDEENLHMLARVVEGAIAKHAQSDPAQLFKLLPSILKARQKVGAALRDNITNLSEVLVDAALKDEAVLKQLVSAIDVEKFEGVVRQALYVKLKLAANKISRTKHEEDYDTEYDQFVFVARPGFEEEPEGSGNYKKVLEIEKMVKVDRFDAKAHQMVAMMKFRASAQGEGSEVYMVHLPAGEFKGGQPPDYLRDLIDQRKKKVTN